MQRILIAIDKLNTWTGKIFSWSIVAMTLVITYEVFSRYVFSAPTSWAYDVSYMLYGALFMMAGPYALARNGHVATAWDQGVANWFRHLTVEPPPHVPHSVVAVN